MFQEEQAHAFTSPGRDPGGNRIPFARSNGAYATASNQAMLTVALEGLVERYRLHGLRMGEVVAGTVLKHSRDMNLTRECVLGSRLSPQTPAYDIQQACGTGLEAALLVANKIAPGRSTVALPAAWTPPPMRRLRSTKACATSCCKPTVAKAWASGSSRSSSCAPPPETRIAA